MRREIVYKEIFKGRYNMEAGLRARKLLIMLMGFKVQKYP